MCCALGDFGTDPHTDSLLFSDHEVRNAWIGPSFPLDLSTLPVRSDAVPLQYPSLSASVYEHSSVAFDADILQQSRCQDWAIRPSAKACHLKSERDLVQMSRQY